MNSLISIIIPIFNASLFLNKCIDSVIHQTHHHLEILLVNDGSTDSSPKIIDEYAAKDKRIVTIHKENGGIGSAYKAAFEVMTGDYVLFVDSDDCLEQDAVGDLVKLAIENEAEMVSFGIRAFNSIGNEVNISSFKNIDLVNTTNAEILRTHFEVLKHPTLVRLYKRELFKGIVIFEQNIGIDEMLTPQLLAKCNRAVYTSKVLYNVLVREDSVCRAEYNEKKVLDTIKVQQFLRGFMEKEIPEYAAMMNEKHFGVAAGMYRFSLENQNIIGEKTRSLARKELLTAFRKPRKHDSLPKKPIKSSIMIILLVFFPFLFKVFKVGGEKN